MATKKRKKVSLTARHPVQYAPAWPVIRREPKKRAHQSSTLVANVGVKQVKKKIT